MKKIAIVAGLVLAGITSSFGQGYFTINNATATGVSNWVTGAQILTANGIKFSSYVVAGTDTNTAVAWTAEQFRDSLIPTFANSTTIGASPGVFVSAKGSVAGTSSGQFVLIQIRAWSAIDPDTSLPINSIDEARATGKANVFWGYSTVLRAKLGTTLSPTTITSAAGVSNPFSGMWVYPAPEPSVLALGALGLVGVYFIRRRK